MSLAHVKTLSRELKILENIGALLEWDMQVLLPKGGFEARAEQSAYLSQLAHEKLTAEANARLLEAAEAETADLPADHDDVRLLRLVRREYDKATKLPTEHVVEFQRTTALAHEVWAQARAHNDFQAFAPTLEKIIGLAVQRAEYLGYKEHPYDPLLDYFEYGAKTSEVRRLFDELKAGLVPLVAAIHAHQDRVGNAILKRHYPKEGQRAFSEKVISKFGFDFQRGRQDVSVHPFCTSFSIHDVRLTTRYDEHWLPGAMFGTFHEAGHGMYDQGFNPAYDQTMLARGTSLGVHESQSRLWENIVGRSRAFWEYFFPELQATFPEALSDVDVETFYKSVNHSAPSFIRVEADEVTYNLHIMLRFDIETDLLTGKLAVKDLPEAWNAKMQEYLGITPPNDALGCLQDVHWSAGFIGYFPTYTLGNLLAAQYYAKAVEAHPNILQDMGRGEFGDLLGWMRQNIHQYGAKFDAAELTQRITGTGIQTGPFLNYLTEKYSAIYGL
jgi:carboxypeptidase Taq